MVSTPLKNIGQHGNLPQVGVKITNLWNHQPVIGYSNSSIIPSNVARFLTFWCAISGEVITVSPSLTHTGIDEASVERPCEKQNDHFECKHAGTWCIRVSLSCLIYPESKRYSRRCMQLGYRCLWNTCPIHSLNTAVTQAESNQKPPQKGYFSAAIRKALHGQLKEH